MPMPNCSPCCSDLDCVLCLQNDTPTDLEIEITGVINDTDPTYCAGCADFNDTYAVSLPGPEGNCGGRYTFPVNPCGGLSAYIDWGFRLVNVDEGGGIWAYHLFFFVLVSAYMNVPFGFETATFSHDLGRQSDSPTCDFDEIVLNYVSEEAPGFYCDWSGATITVRNTTP